MASQPICHKCKADLNAGDKFCLQCGTPVAIQRKPIPKLYIIAGCILIVGLAIFFIHRPLFYQILSLCSTAMLIFTITIMVITFRKAKKVSATALTISMLISAFCLMIYSKIINADIGNLASITALGSGALIGVGWSLTSRLMLTKTGVRRKGGVGYLIVWGMIFAINQITALATGRPPRIAMVLLFMSAGLMIGHNLSLLVRSERLKAVETEQ